MKKLPVITALICLAFLFTQCKDLLDVEEDISFVAVFNVNTQQESFTRSQIYDLASNVDVIEEYGSKIKEVNINRVEIWITSLQAVEGQTFSGGSISVSRQDGSGETLVASLGGLVIQDLLNNKTTLTHNSEGIKLLGNLAADPPHRFQLHTQGDINEGPLAFIINMEFTGKMVANPLN